MKISPYRSDYLSVSSTTAIKGIFAIIILLSHTRQYYVLGTGTFDHIFEFTMRYLGQLMVAPFFFYSGFGICESVKHKEKYVNSFFFFLILKTLLHFDLAVLLFLIVHTFLGHHFKLNTYLLCWVGWEDIGNSGWFVFVILILYLITYLTLRLKDCFAFSAVFVPTMVSIFTIGIWAALFLLKSPQNWWYNTLAVFPLGMWYSVLSDKFAFKENSVRITVSIIFLVIFVVWHKFFGIDKYGVSASIFVLALTAASFFVRVDNPVLQWLGNHCFSIYILHQIPMIVFRQTPLVNYPIVFTASAIIVSLALAYGFNLFTDKIDAIIFKSKSSDLTPSIH